LGWQIAKIKEYKDQFLNDPYLQGLNTYKSQYPIMAKKIMNFYGYVFEFLALVMFCWIHMFLKKNVPLCWTLELFLNNIIIYICQWQQKPIKIKMIILICHYLYKKIHQFVYFFYAIIVNKLDIRYDQSYFLCNLFFCDWLAQKHVFKKIYVQKI